MVLIHCKEIKKSFGDKCVLRDITVNIHENQRIGLVGNNGAGKTTFANILAGRIKPDEGTIQNDKDKISIGYLVQSTAYTVNSFNDMVGSITENVMEDFLQTTSQLGLNKVQEWDESRINGMSGGERTKIALAQVWKSKPTILILDEPTNHMDYNGVQWLIEELKKYEGTVILISHDRYFLDRTVEVIYELEGGILNEYKGNYSFYRKEKARRYEVQMHQYQKEKKEQKQIEEQIYQLQTWSAKAHRESTSEKKTMGSKEFKRAKAKKMDQQIKSRIKRLQKMQKEAIERPKEEQKIGFEIDTNGKRGRRILEAQEIKKGYGKRVLFHESSFYIQRGEKIGVIGENGCGKTTLIKLILRKETMEQGNLWVSPTTKIGYLSQDVMDLPEDQNPLEALDLIKGEHHYITQGRTLLANMGFDHKMLTTEIRNLSLGERTRIKIAELILQEHDFIVMDEPTNHLDLHSREKLEETLMDYGGTVLIVSHDQYLIERLCDKLLVFTKQHITRIETGLEQYRLKTSSESSTVEKIKKVNKEEQMLIENRIAFVLGELSKYSLEDPCYKELDKEFHDLIQKKKVLTSPGLE